MRILVVGGTGFIGQHLISRLARSLHAIDVPTRMIWRGRELLVYPTVTVLQRNVHDEVALDRLVQGKDVVINLAGILHSRPGRPYGPDFAAVHVDLPRKLAQACVRQGVRRLIHVSALGAGTQASSQYLRSKAAGEEALWSVSRQSDCLDVTIFRPSVVFGPGDNFMNLFARLARYLPVLPLAASGSRMQPVYVGDVCTALELALERRDTCGQVYELAGPSVHTLGELATMAAKWSGHPRKVLNLPEALGRLQAWFLEKLPGEPLMSRDNLDSLKTDNVLTGESGLVQLGLTPTALDQIVPSYLKKRPER